MRYWRLKPDARLHPGIVCYYVALPAIDAPVEERWREELLLPDGYSEIVFNLTSAFERWAVGDLKRSTMRGSYVIGGRSQSILTRNLGDLTIIGVKLESAALRRLIATPLAEFRDATLTLAELNQRALFDLEDALVNATSIEHVRELLDQFFLARSSILEPGDQLVSELLASIRAAHGSLAIMRWIRDRDVDLRHFERRFCAWTGMTPKRYARLVRFKHSYYQWLLGEGRRGAKGGHLASYYDQSHFHRDFKHFLGVAPGLRLKQAAQPGTDISEHLMLGEFRAA
jgi:AraC-like DNA-binding protein